MSEWNADGIVVRMVDLDLDVVRPRGGEAHVEDEDEFAEHRVRYGYPDRAVAVVMAWNPSFRRTATGSASSGSQGANGRC
ncbi:DUF402 domain-containing protein, partial [Streptomyces sp. NPDC005143]